MIVKVKRRGSSNGKWVPGKNDQRHPSRKGVIGPQVEELAKVFVKEDGYAPEPE